MDSDSMILLLNSIASSLTAARETARSADNALMHAQRAADSAAETVKRLEAIRDAMRVDIALMDQTDVNPASPHNT